MWKETSWFSCFGPTWSLFVNFHNGQMKLKPWPRFDKGRLWAKFQLDWKSKTMSMSPIFSVSACRGFTRELVSTYNKVKEAGKTLKLFLWVHSVDLSHLHDFETRNFNVCVITKSTCCCESAAAVASVEASNLHAAHDQYSIDQTIWICRNF